MASLFGTRYFSSPASRSSTPRPRTSSSSANSSQTSPSKRLSTATTAASVAGPSSLSSHPAVIGDITTRSRTSTDQQQDGDWEDLSLATDTALSQGVQEDSNAERFVLLDTDEKKWARKEAELTEQIDQAHTELKTLTAERDRLLQTKVELTMNIKDVEAELAHAKAASEAAVVELEDQLSGECIKLERAKIEIQNHEDTLRAARQRIGELEENIKAANVNNRQLSKQMVQRSNSLTEVKQAQQVSLDRIRELEDKVVDLNLELDRMRVERERAADTRAGLQREIDQLRAAMLAKTDEETRRGEVERSQAMEIDALRERVGRQQQEAAEARQVADAVQRRLMTDVAEARRERHGLERAQQELEDKLAQIESRWQDAQTGMAEAEKAKRVAEVKVQSLLTRQVDIECQLGEVTNSRKSLERQLEDLKSTKERQLNDAQSKLQSLNAYVISLEGSEARMKVEIDRKQEELANAKTTIAVHDNRANQATNDYDKERQAKELAQKKAQFYQNSLIKAQAQHTEMERKLEEAVRDKERATMEHADAVAALSRQLAEEKEARSSAESRMRRYKTERNEARERLKGAAA